jgi:DNA-binding phage protein
VVNERGCNVDLRTKIKIECVKKNIGITDLALKIGMSRQNLYHHLKHRNESVIKKIEKELELSSDFFKDNYSN